MSIKRKRPGAEPIYDDRWRELAKDERRFVEAAAEYRREFPNATLVEAARAVKAQHQRYTQQYKPSKRR